MSDRTVVLPAPKAGDVIYVPYEGFHYSWRGEAQQITGGRARVEEVWPDVSGYLNVRHLVKVEGHPIPYLWEIALAPYQDGLKREFGDRWSHSSDWEH